MVGLLLALALLLALLPPSGSPEAEAAGKIKHVKVAAISTSAFRVTLKSLGKGWKYTLYASTDKEDVAVAHLPDAPYRVSSKTPDLTLRDLPSSTTVYWYRIRATKKKSHHTSGFYDVGLRPVRPEGLQPTRVERGAVRLSWSGSAERFEVQQASDGTFRSDRRSYSVTSGAHAVTPYGLEPGRRYWFRVRGANHRSSGRYSTSVSVDATAREQRVRAMTFNLLTLTADGSTPSGGEQIAPWSERRVAAARAIVAAEPDVVALQEGGAYVGTAPGPRQVDSLVDALPASYALARTEVPPPQPGYYRVGSYIVYQPAVLTPVGDGGSWDLGAAGEFHKWAVYQQFRQRSTGATFLFVSAHLVAGEPADAMRLAETRSLLRQARAYAAGRGGLPVVYAGDYNSHQKHALDGPAVAMSEVGATDSRHVAGRLTNEQYNSSNLYMRKPPAFGLAMDHIYVSPGIGVGAWGESLDLEGGRFSGVIPSDHNPVWTDLFVPR